MQSRSPGMLRGKNLDTLFFRFTCSTLELQLYKFIRFRECGPYYPLCGVILVDKEYAAE